MNEIWVRGMVIAWLICWALTGRAQEAPQSDAERLLRLEEAVRRLQMQNEVLREELEQIRGGRPPEPLATPTHEPAPAMARSTPEERRSREQRCDFFGGRA